MKKLTLKSKILIIVLICSMMAILPIAIVSIVNNIKASYIQAAASPTDINGDGVYDYRIDGHEQTFEIYNLLGLKKFRDNVNSGTTYSGWTITLENNIDNVGNFGTSIGITGDGFSGVFDGKGYRVSGITSAKAFIDYTVSASDELFVGLFCKIKDATIRNLWIKDSALTASSDVAGTYWAGFLSTHAINSSFINCRISNSSMSISFTGTDWIYVNGLSFGQFVSYSSGCNFIDCMTIDTSVTYTDPQGSKGDDFFHFGGVISYGSATIKNCIVGNYSYTVNATVDDNETGKGSIVCGKKGHNFSGGADVTISNSFVACAVNNSLNSTGTLNKTNLGKYTDNSDWGGRLNTHRFSNSSSLDDSNIWFFPNSNEYNAGIPIQKVFVDYETYEVKTVENSDQHAIDKGTVNISSFSVPIPKDDSSTKYIGIPNNDQTGYTFTVDVIDQFVVATPSCETCRQFSHWEVNGKTITAHFKEKEVPANCTVKFNGHSFANTTSKLGLYEFKLHPGSTIKCVESNNGRTYTYIVVKGGDCPDCDRPLTTGEEYARITYTIKIDAGQPASKYELDSLDSGGFIKKTNVLYTITKSTTISPTFILKEYDIEIG